MNKVIKRYQATCPYCAVVLKYELLASGKKRMWNQCKHFYRFRGDHMVCFCTTQDVEVEEVKNA